MHPSLGEENSLSLTEFWGKLSGPEKGVITKGVFSFEESLESLKSLNSLESLELLCLGFSKNSESLTSLEISTKNGLF